MQRMMSPSRWTNALGGRELAKGETPTKLRLPRSVQPHVRGVA